MERNSRSGLSFGLGAVLCLALPAGTALAQAAADQNTAPVPAHNADASPTVTAGAQNGTIQGKIQAGGVPLPGVAVTATSATTGKKYTTTTDVDGAYGMAVPAGGYTIGAELAGFALENRQITVTAANGSNPASEVADFSMDLASRAETKRPETASTTGPAGTTAAPQGARTQPGGGSAGSGNAAGTGPGRRSGGGAGQTASNGGPDGQGTSWQGQRQGAGSGRGTVARVGRGTQTIEMQNSQDADLLDASQGQANSGVTMPSLGTVSADDPTGSLSSDTVAVSGQQGQTNGLANFSEDNIRDRMDQMRQAGGGNTEIAGMLMGAMAGGGLGGPGGGPGGQGGPGGGGGGGGFGAGGGGGGGRGGGGGGFGGGGGGFGRNFRQNSNAWHGTAAYNGSDSALNAIPFSVTGRPVSKPESDTNSLVVSLTGTPYIPKLTKPNPKQFVFLTLSETRNTVPTIVQAVVPTAAQRLGDLTGQATAYDPATGQPYGNANCSAALLAIDPSPAACVPAYELSPAAQALLNYYPLPNITPVGTNDNFQTVTTARTHSTQVSGRYNRSFGATTQGRGFGGFGGGRGQQNQNAKPTLRQSIAENFAYSHQASSSQSFSQLLGGRTESNGYNLSSSYTVGYGRLNDTVTVGWNRSAALNANYFTNGLVNPAVAAGIDVGDPTIYSNPFYFGVPSVSLGSSFASLSDVTPSNTINQTMTASESLSWVHGKHNMRFGLDFHRIHMDSIGGTGGGTNSSPLGTFAFSGFATESPAQQQCASCTANTGSALADLLIGQPQQTQITAGLYKSYLRGNSYDWYGQDDWRVHSNVTLLFGLRWEYFSPYSEKNGRLVNLLLNESGNNLAITNICATAATGCEQVGSGTLVAPDKAMYSPRIGLAWSPKFKFTKSTVIRTGYGINYNTGQYATFARKLAFQQPFAVTQTNTLASGSDPDTGCTMAGTPYSGSAMTLANGFNCSTQLVQSNYGVDPNYRLGMVQVYNFGIQRTLPQGIVLNVDYNGAYAGNLDMLRAPNRTPTGVLNEAVTQFTYEDSLGYQRSNALAINLRQRMHKGIALGATYTYSHSIDDASSIGGSGSGTIAQNDQDLGAEESNSTFDRRHVLSGNYVIELPFGPNRAFLNKGGAWAHVLDGFSLSGNFTFASGTWATPVYSGTSSEVASGSGASLRPNRVFSEPIAGAGTLKSWFNTTAFTAPVDANGNLMYGNASRNSIEMPGTVSVNGVLSRTFSMGETRSLETRITVSNLFNTVQYSNVDTTLGSPTFGQVTGAAAMRSFTYLARYRF